MIFRQSRSIADFRPLIDTLIPDFGYVFLHTVLQWCNLANDSWAERDGVGQFWEVFLLEDEGEVVGICGLYSLTPGSTEELWLGWFALVPEKRNGGRGREAMQFMYEKARTLGCKRLMSYVDKEGKPISFYKREGFEVLGTVREFLDANSMRKIDGDDFESPEDFVIQKNI